jgi:hypothetical protein
VCRIGGTPPPAGSVYLGEEDKLCPCDHMITNADDCEAAHFELDLEPRYGGVFDEATTLPGCTLLVGQNRVMYNTNRQT